MSRGAHTSGPPPPCIIGTITNTGAPLVNATQPTFPGYTISVTSNGTWSTCGDTITGYNYEWFRNGSLIAGAPNSVNYTAQVADSKTLITAGVQACDNYGCYPSYVPTSDGINVHDRPNPPSSPSPADGSSTTDTTPTLSTVYTDPIVENGYVSYSLYRCTDGALMATNSGPIVASGQASPWTVTTALAVGECYYWYAQAGNTDGYSSTAVGPYTFYVPPTVPTINSPSPSGLTLSTVTPVLSASATSREPISYEFQVSTDPGFANVIADSDWPPTTNTWTVSAGVLKDGTTYYWRAAAADDYGTTSAWSSPNQSFSIQLPKLGARDYWAIWSHGPLAVNEANGNLVVSAPGPSYPTSAGAMGASLTYNSQSAATDNGFGIGWALNVGDDSSSPPIKLIDHNTCSSCVRLDAMERISADGSSDYYTDVGGTNTYVSAQGDGSQLTKNSDTPSTWTLVDPDGAVYTFLPETTDGTATAFLKSAEWVDATPGKGSLTYVFSPSHPTEVDSITDDSGRVLNFAWANASDTGTCSTAILCVTSPDGNTTWKYIGDGTGGTSGKLVTVWDGTRNVLQLAYNGNLVNSIKNANDLDSTHASPNYNSNHALTVTYDNASPSKVTCVIAGPITGQAATAQPSSCVATSPASESTWLFSYHPGSVQPPTPPRASHYGYLVRNDAPLAYYPLDETTGTTAADASGNGNNGTYSGGHTLVQPGALAGTGAGTAVAFSGGNVAGSAANINTTPGAYNTVEMWINWNGTDSEMPFLFSGSSYDLWIFGGYFGFNSGHGDIWGTTAPTPNTWHHIVAEFYNGSLTQSRLWVDGTQQPLAQVRQTGNFTANASSAFNISGTTYTFTGSIDEVAIYDYALPPTQIVADYAEGKHNRTADGYTTLTPPKQEATTCPTGCASVSTYYDNLGHPIETIDTLGRTSESYYNSEDQPIWSEDPDGNPTDNLYGGSNGKPNGNPYVAGGLLQTIGPDPDGAGPLTRPVATTRYDETSAGTTQTPGPSLNGLHASYYDNPNLVGRAKAIANDANVDFNWPSGPPALTSAGYSVAGGFSVRWSGDLVVTSPGSYVFSTPTSTGTRLTVDGTQAIDNWTTSAPTSQPIILSAGLHSLELDYFSSTSSGQVHLDWACSGCSASVIASTSLLPAWFNQTSTVSPASRISYSHFDQPWTGNPQYNLVTAPVNGTNTSLVTSYTYDPYGRISGKVMPAGNPSPQFNALGDLTNPPDPTTSTYGTAYTYYNPGDTASPPSAPDCAGSSVNQGEQLKTATTHSEHNTVYVYDATGNTLASTNGAGTTCSQYNSENRLTSTQAPADSAATTFTYDPAGAQLTASGPTGMVTTYYDEQGRLVDTIDSNGAEAKFTYDPDGNQVSRTAAKGSLASNPNYTTGFSYDATDQLTGETDPAGRAYSFFYDSRGNLRGTQYPNGTFSWVDTNPAGWITDQYNRHGTINANTTTPPSDSSPLADYTYSNYDLDGKRQSELRKSSSTSQTTTYSYDSLGRLNQVVLPSGVCRNYGYDRDSNRVLSQQYTSGCSGSSTSTNYTYDPTNGNSLGVDELTKTVVGSTTTNYTYTSDGQTSSKGTTAFTWDGWTRLKNTTVGSNTVTYTYDPTGALKTRTSSSPSTTTNYLLGDLFETNSSGTITTSYADGPAGNLTSFDGPPTTSSTPTYLYYDAHGNLAAEANSSGTITGNHTYDASGAPNDSSPANTTVHRFVGRWNKQYDTTSGDILMGARPYDPTIGRFLSVDPIPGGSLNNYDYAGQDPINNYDLTGTCLGIPFSGRCPWDKAVHSAGHLLRGAQHLFFHSTESIAYFPYWFVCTKLGVPFTEGLINLDRAWDRAAGKSDRDEGRKGHYLPRIPGIGYVGPTTRFRGVNKHGTIQRCR